MPLLQLGAGGPCTCRAVVMLCAPLVKHCPSTITLRYYAGGPLLGGAEKRNTERWGGMPCWRCWLRYARKAKSLGGLAVRQRYVSVSQQPFKQSRNPGRPQFVCIVRLRHVEDVESSNPRMPAILYAAQCSHGISRPMSSLVTVGTDLAVTHCRDRGQNKAHIRGRGGAPNH